MAGSLAVSRVVRQIRPTWRLGSYRRPELSSRRIDLRQRKQSLPERQTDQLDIRTDAKLALGEIAGIRHGLQTDVEDFGDLLGRFSVEQHAQHFELPRRQH